MFALVVSGCAAPSSSTPGTVDPWNGAEEILILDAHGDSVYEFDVLCQTGGGPHLPRDGPGRVLGGSHELRADVRVDRTFTGIQVGHVISVDPRADETQEPNLEWLPWVPGGSASTFSIPLTQGPFEDPEGRTVWQFYYRMQTPAPTDCYTGGGTGKWDIIVTAVRAPGGRS